MNGKRLAIFRALLNHFHPTTADQFFKVMPSDDVKQIISNDVQPKGPIKYFEQPFEFIQRIHFSWLIASFEKMTPELQLMIASALPEVQKKGICRYFKLPVPDDKLLLFIKTFLLTRVFNDVYPRDVLPISFLPVSQFSPLLEMDKLGLTELIDFLGIYDLSEDIRYIVDKQKLKDVYQCLSQEKLLFLRNCLHQKSKIMMPKLELEKWKGDCDKLQEMLHRRGMVRLGKALYGQHKDFIWHLCHAIDTGRGAILQKYSEEEMKTASLQALSLQIVNTMNFLKKMSSP